MGCCQAVKHCMHFSTCIAFGLVDWLDLVHAGALTCLARADLLLFLVCLLALLCCSLFFHCVSDDIGAQSLF